MALIISRILHAGYVFECEGTRIAFDTVFENPFSRNCHAFPDVRFDEALIRRQRFDAVFISHLHDDHCSLESLDLLSRDTPIFLYCLFDELFDMIRALGFGKVQRLYINTPVAVGPIEVIPREALDADVDSMFQVRAAGLNVLNVVDAWIGPDALDLLARYAPWDMVLWPFQTMREIAVLAPTHAEPVPEHLPEDWFEQLAVLRPRYVVPSSCQFVQEAWSWYKRAFFPISYRQFKQEVQAALPAIEVVRLNPGVSVTLDAQGLQPAPALAWVQPVGEQDVDYAFDAQTKPPPTADIARRFAALTAQQEGTVLAFVRSGLLARYREMELQEDSYFAQPRNWRLTLYKHDGTALPFLYRIEGDAIESIGEAEALGWTTDIPTAKVHAALALGESLSTLYLRINDAQFDAQTEIDLKEADIVDDPLIRCLYNDAVGAYQAAQLQRLKLRGRI
ncbi:MAG: MBL fold metallo-hydrolase [Pseudomonadota bacterium]